MECSKIFKRHLLILLFLAIVFFFIYSYLNFTVSTLIFNSPDETAGYFFSRLFANSLTKLQNGYENYEKLNLSRLQQLEPLNFLAPGLIHPRSILVNSSGYLVPGSFLGMLLIYGFLGKIFTSVAIPFFTPFFAVIGVLAFYFLIRKIWGENIGFLSAILMFFLPPYWYYATRGMFPNVLFTALLIMAACFLFCVPCKSLNHAEDRIIAEPRSRSLNYAEDKRIVERRGKVWEYVRYVGGGLFLGLALITRTSEIVWIAILGLALAIYFFKKIYWPAAILGVAIFCATFLPIFYQNKILYGSIFKFGYNISAVQKNNPTVEYSTYILSPNHTEQSTEQHRTYSLPTSSSTKEREKEGGEKFQSSSAIKNIFSLVQRFLLPFGFHPRVMLQNFWNYFVKFFWWFTIPMILGFFIFLIQRFRVIPRGVPRSSAIKSFFSLPQMLYFQSFLFISAYLFIYYGGWQFFDNINRQVTIGTSYLRYWLPIFVMGLPFMVIFLKKISSFLTSPNSPLYKGGKWGDYTLFIFLYFYIFIFLMSAISVFSGEDEGIFYVKNNLLRYNNIRSQVLNLIPKNSIIITERSDKIFFPYRRIIVWNRGERFDEGLRNLSKFAPLYYYNLAFTNEEFKNFNQVLNEQGLKLELVKVFGNEGLYKLNQK